MNTGKTLRTLVTAISASALFAAAACGSAQVADFQKAKADHDAGAGASGGFGPGGGGEGGAT